MRRRIVVPVLVGTLLLGGVPALADANGSSEQRTVKRSCSAKPDPHYSAPKGTDCKGTAKTYQATHYSNDVKCGSKNALTPANPSGLRVYASGDPAKQSGRVDTCSDGSGAAPGTVQGRASVGGSTAQGPRLVVDGDKDNGHETMRGYLMVEGTSYRCGHDYADGGRGDSDAPEDKKDTREDCG